jgi:hypothetical protein
MNPEEKRGALLILDALLDEAGTAKGIMMELEQKMARSAHYGGGKAAPLTWGRQVADSDQVKALEAVTGSQPGRVKIEVKDITTATDSGGALDNTMRDPSVNGLPGRTPRIRRRHW